MICPGLVRLSRSSRLSRKCKTSNTVAITNKSKTNNTVNNN